MKSLVESFAPVALGLLLIALVAVGLVTVYDTGHSAGFASAKAQGDTALAALRLANESEKARAADAAAKDMQAAAENLLAEQARGNQLAADLGAKKTELRTVTDKLNREIQNVTTLYRRAIGAQAEPLPPALFTAGFVRVWNDALSGAVSPVPMPASGTATGGTDATPNGAGTADDLIVGITRADLLTNHVRNGEGYASCRAQLNALIDWNTNHGRN
jgi:hypothetical protein